LNFDVTAYAPVRDDAIVHNSDSNEATLCLVQDLVDKCAEMTARPDAIQELTNAMAQLSDSYHDVDAMLEEIKALVTEEEESEKVSHPLLLL
jgi:hypothetical protein